MTRQTNCRLLQLLLQLLLLPNQLTSHARDGESKDGFTLTIASSANKLVLLQRNIMFFPVRNTALAAGGIGRRRHRRRHRRRLYRRRCRNFWFR